MMRAGILISVGMWAVVIAAYLLASGCSALPSVRYCDQIIYERIGSKISIMAECTTSGVMGL